MEFDFLLDGLAQLAAVSRGLLFKSSQLILMIWENIHILLEQILK